MEDFKEYDPKESIIKNNDVLVETYKGHEIYDLDKKKPDTCHGVYDPFNKTFFLVGLDDSKRCGHRTSTETTVQDARNYIDWKLRMSFDDIVEDEEYGDWSQVCKKHKEQFAAILSDESAGEDEICGVKGCNNKAKHYVSIPADPTPKNDNVN